MDYISKSARLDHLMKQEIESTIGGGSEIPEGDFRELLGYDLEGKPVAVVLGPEHWTDPGLGIPVNGIHFAVYEPEEEFMKMRFFPSGELGTNILRSTLPEQVRNFIGAGTSNLTIGTTGTTAAAGNHTHVANTINMTGYGQSSTSGESVLVTDNVSVAIGKLEKRIADLEAALAP